MPLKLNIGVSKKVGEANYGSRGASVNLELELESFLVDNPDRLKERVRQLFDLAKASVDEELNGSASPAERGLAANSTGRRDATRRSTASQARALNAIADRQKIDLTKLLRDRYGVELAGELTITQASECIDLLKVQTNGNGAGGRR